LRSYHPSVDHIVSVMFENRSFDNLLGRLYQPGEVASFRETRLRSGSGML